MSGDEDELSFFCQTGRHGECGHERGSAFSIFGKTEQRALLCVCSCHGTCPLGGRGQVPLQAWTDKCTCPGSERQRESLARIAAESDERRRRQKEVMDSIDLGRGKSATEIQKMIVEGYVARGWEPPGDFSRAARFIAAATARRGRRTRLLVETVQGLHAAKKWLAKLPHEDDREDDS